MISIYFSCVLIFYISCTRYSKAIGKTIVRGWRDRGWGPCQQHVRCKRVVWRRDRRQQYRVNSIAADVVVRREGGWGWRWRWRWWGWYLSVEAALGGGSYDGGKYSGGSRKRRMWGRCGPGLRHGKLDMNSPQSSTTWPPRMATWFLRFFFKWRQRGGGGGGAVAHGAWGCLLVNAEANLVGWIGNGERGRIGAR